MKKLKVLRVFALVILNVMIFSMGMTTFAAVRPPDAEIQWRYLVACSYLFEIDEELEDYDIFACGASTLVPSGYRAYASAELQYYDEENDRWIMFAYWANQGPTAAGVERYIEVVPGYTYRLYIEHKALSLDGVLLESFTQYSTYYLASFPRS